MASNPPWGKSFTLQKRWSSNIYPGKKGINIVIWHIAPSTDNYGHIAYSIFGKKELHFINLLIVLWQQ